MSKLLNTFQWLKRKPGRLSVGLIMTAMMAASCSDMDEYMSFAHLIYADLLITSKSSFSYKPALMNTGIKVCPGNFAFAHVRRLNLVAQHLKVTSINDKINIFR